MRIFRLDYRTAASRRIFQRESGSPRVCQKTESLSIASFARARRCRPEISLGRNGARSCRCGAAGLRDYSLFVFFAATGGRRDEITKLRGNDIKIQNGIVTYYPRTKGGKRAGKVVDNPLVGQALLDYLAASNRKPEQVFGRDVPLWMPHDIGRAGRLKRKKKEAEQAAEQALAVRGSSRPKPEKQSGLTSHSFARLMKAYAARAGIYDFNLHKIRHTFARIVHEDTQSLPETQNALGHRSPDTTRIYVPNITIESNTHGSRLQNRIGL